jgi:hypothetical protein
LDNFVRTRSVADDITQIDGYVISGRGRQAGLKSFEIAVNVA